jgi:eukaryotic-like serine/threonine-protein kinase
MAFTTGTNLGPYELLQPIGAGGFGQVYKARDTRLNRFVAVKVLPEHLSHNAELKSRFAREATILAGLNHPHICSIFDVGEHGATNFIVMELVDGVTLAERLRNGALPLEEALKIAIQIADALDKAHRQGVIHRDVKPSNVMLTKSGVKVLDFGLAKVKAGTEAPDFSSLPTRADITAEGAILGTLQYMAPEQLEGQEADARTDIFAFGSIVHEMVTGKRAFEGKSQACLIGSILKDTPKPISQLQPVAPPALDYFVKLCLVKDPDQRWQTAHDARLELESIIENSAHVRTPILPGNGKRRKLQWILPAITLLFGLSMAVPLAQHFRGPDPMEMRVDIATPRSSAPFEFALSPDGTRLAFVADDTGLRRLWLRSLDAPVAQPLPGTDGATLPFWSPDSRSIGFFTLDKLYHMEINGQPQFLANTIAGRGATWNTGGSILFAAVQTGPIWQIAASGGQPAALTKLDPPRQTGHWFPQFLPDGHHFLFYAKGDASGMGIYLGSIAGGTKRLTAADAPGAFLPPDWVVFMQQTLLVARRLDIGRAELTGDSIKLADKVGSNPTGAAGFSVSTAGTIAYRRSTGESRRQLSWFDRTGKLLGVIGDPGTSSFSDPELSSDGSRIAVFRSIENNDDVWLIDLIRSGFTRLTFDSALDRYPVWSPDGLRILFSHDTGVNDLYIKPSNGVGSEELLVHSPNPKFPQDWSDDGRFILYYEVGATTRRDLWALDMTQKERKPQVVVNTPFDETMAQFSPDGRWIAFQTNESGRPEIVVQSFPDVIGKWQVSTSGGSQPRWSHDGSELYFVALDGTLMAAPVNGRSAAFETGAPVTLFSSRIPESIVKPEYTVSRDGRFLINQTLDDSAPTPITLILNWKPKQ